MSATVRRGALLASIGSEGTRVRRTRCSRNTLGVTVLSSARHDVCRTGEDDSLLDICFIALVNIVFYGPVKKVSRRTAFVFETRERRIVSTVSDQRSLFTGRFERYLEREPIREGTLNHQLPKAT